MRFVITFLALGALVQTQTFKLAVDQVLIPVAVVSDFDEPVGDLQQDDFRVFDDGHPVTIAAFGRFHQPIHLVVLLDTSRSMWQSLDEARAAAAALLAHLRPGDSVRIGTFSNILRLSPPLSSSDEELLNRLLVAPGANMTSLHDALLEAFRVFAALNERRVIFVVTDGMDTASSASASAVVSRAAVADVTIYAVGLDIRISERGRSIVRAPDSNLRRIAEDTGGRYVHGADGRDLSRAFGAMIDDLHQQYLLAFTPTASDGRLHPLVVTVRRPNMRVRARKNYWAPLSQVDTRQP